MEPTFKTGQHLPPPPPASAAGCGSSHPQPLSTPRPLPPDSLVTPPPLVGDSSPPPPEGISYLKPADPAPRDSVSIGLYTDTKGIQYELFVDFIDAFGNQVPLNQADLESALKTTPFLTTRSNCMEVVQALLKATEEATGKPVFYVTPTHIGSFGSSGVHTPFTLTTRIDQTNLPEGLTTPDLNHAAQDISKALNLAFAKMRQGGDLRPRIRAKQVSSQSTTRSSSPPPQPVGTYTRPPKRRFRSTPAPPPLLRSSEDDSPSRSPSPLSRSPTPISRTIPRPAASHGFSDLSAPRSPVASSLSPHSTTPVRQRPPHTETFLRELGSTSRIFLRPNLTPTRREESSDNEGSPRVSPHPPSTSSVFRASAAARSVLPSPSPSSRLTSPSTDSFRVPGAPRSVSSPVSGPGSVVRSGRPSVSESPPAASLSQREALGQTGSAFRRLGSSQLRDGLSSSLRRLTNLDSDTYDDEELRVPSVSPHPPSTSSVFRASGAASRALPSPSPSSRLTSPSTDSSRVPGTPRSVSPAHSAAPLRQRPSSAHSAAPLRQRPSSGAQIATPMTGPVSPAASQPVARRGGPLHPALTLEQQARARQLAGRYL